MKVVPILIPGFSDEDSELVNRDWLLDEIDEASDPLDGDVEDYPGLKRVIRKGLGLSRIHKKKTENGYAFSCPICGYTMNRLGKIEKHIMGVHDKPLSDKITYSLVDNKQIFTCNICGKICNNRSSMDRHLVTHEDIGQITCEKCGKTCKNSHGLLTHQKLCTK